MASRCASAPRPSLPSLILIFARNSAARSPRSAISPPSKPLRSRSSTLRHRAAPSMISSPVLPPPPITAPAGLSAQQSRTLVAQLKRSQVYRDYEQAFRETTGLPITLRPTEAFDLPHHGDPKEAPFCALM